MLFIKLTCSNALNSNLCIFRHFSRRWIPITLRDSIDQNVSADPAAPAPGPAVAPAASVAVLAASAVAPAALADVSAAAPVAAPAVAPANSAAVSAASVMSTLMPLLRPCCLCCCPSYHARCHSLVAAPLWAAAAVAITAVLFAAPVTSACSRSRRSRSLCAV